MVIHQLVLNTAKPYISVMIPRFLNITMVCSKTTEFEIKSLTIVMQFLSFSYVFSMLILIYLFILYICMFVATPLVRKNGHGQLPEVKLSINQSINHSYNVTYRIMFDRYVAILLCSYNCR